MDNITNVRGELPLIQRLSEATLHNDEELFDALLRNSDIDKQLKSINQELSLNFAFRYNVYICMDSRESTLRLDLSTKVDKHIFNDEKLDIHNRYFSDSFNSKLYISYFILNIKIINNIIYIQDTFNTKTLANLSIFDLDDFSTEIYLNTLIDITGIGIRVDIFIEMLKIYILAYNKGICVKYIDFSHDMKFQVQLIKFLRGLLE